MHSWRTAYWNINYTSKWNWLSTRRVHKNKIIQYYPCHCVVLQTPDEKICNDRYTAHYDFEQIYVFAVEARRMHNGCIIKQIWTWSSCNITFYGTLENYIALCFASFNVIFQSARHPSKQLLLISISCQTSLTSGWTGRFWFSPKDQVLHNHAAQKYCI